MNRKSALVALISVTTTFAADWIWTGEQPPNPKNRFTYFRRVVDLPAAPEQASFRFAADSNARLWINGQVVRRKVTRFHEDRATAELINAAPYLKPGHNVIVVLHHNWGPIITFQRSANVHAGLYIDGPWLRTGPDWRWLTAPEFLAHEKQIVGVNTHARIRYPVIIDGRKSPPAAIHDAGFDDSSWKRAVAVTAGPWPASPAPVEAVAQREYAVRPEAVIAAGALGRPTPDSSNPLAIAAAIRNATYNPDPDGTSAAASFVSGKPLSIQGAAGGWRYVTFDLHRPVHGYPFIELSCAAPGAVIDFGYAEIARSLYSGQAHVKPDGWLNPEGVVGPGYADRYTCRQGRQRIEIPDERTARWLSLQVYFPAASTVTLHDAGFVKSQFPVRLAGSFDSGNERVAQIVKLCLIHAEVTMNDVYIDTPGREDGQWIEDSRVRALIAERWFGDHTLRQVLLRHYAESQGPDGGFHAFPPANFPAYPVAYDWSVQWSAMLYDDYYWTGSTALIERYWNTLERYWNDALARVGPDGIFRTSRVFADIRVGTRLNNQQQSSGIVSPFMIDRLRWSSEMARAIGKKETADLWTRRAEEMSAAYATCHMVAGDSARPALAGDRFDPRDPSLTRGFSQAAQAMAILAGLMTPEQARAALDYTFPAPDGMPPQGVARWNNPTFAYRSLRVLAENGLTQRATAHLLERYAPYLPGHPSNLTPAALQGPYGGPLPEYWVSREDLSLKEGQENPAQPVDDTGSHGWGAVPLLWLHDTLLGVRISKPGGAELTIAPEAAGLPFVSGHTLTPKGDVWVNWEPAQFRLEVRIPQGVRARLTLPEPLRGMAVRCEHQGAAPERSGPSTYILNDSAPYVFNVN